MLNRENGTIGDRTARILSHFIILAAVTGCEQVSSTPLSGKLPLEGDLIVLVTPAESNPQWAGIAGGARRFLERYPALRLETFTPPDNRGESLLRVVNDALAKKPKAVCLYVHESATARAAAEAVVNSATILVTLGVDLDVAGVFGHVREDLAGAAELLGKHLTEIAGDKRSYILLHRNGVCDQDTRCYERFMSKACAHIGISLLEERNAGKGEQPPTKLVRAMFARFRHAGLVVTLEPSVWLTTSPAKLLGRNARFATVGAAPSLWGYLRSGEAAALAGSVDGELGALAAELALGAMTDNQKAGVIRMVPSELVTPETLDDFAKRYAEAAGLELRELLPPPASQPAVPTDP